MLPILFLFLLVVVLLLPQHDRPLLEPALAPLRGNDELPWYTTGFL